MRVTYKYKGTKCYRWVCRKQNRACPRRPTFSRCPVNFKRVRVVYNFRGKRCVYFNCKRVCRKPIKPGRSCRFGVIVRENYKYKGTKCYRWVCKKRGCPPRGRRPRCHRPFATVRVTYRGCPRYTCRCVPPKGPKPRRRCRRGWTVGKKRVRWNRVSCWVWACIPRRR